MLFPSLTYCRNAQTAQEEEPQKLGNKVTIRLSVGCVSVHILQHGGGIRVGRKHTRPTLRHEVPGSEEMRNCSGGAFPRSASGRCLGEPAPSFQQSAQDSPGRWPHLLEAAARDCWHRRVKVPLPVFFPVSPSFHFYVILLVQFGFPLPLSFHRNYPNQMIYWSSLLVPLYYVSQLKFYFPCIFFGNA